MARFFLFLFLHFFKETISYTNVSYSNCITDCYISIEKKMHIKGGVVVDSNRTRRMSSRGDYEMGSLCVEGCVDMCGFSGLSFVHGVVLLVLVSSRLLHYYSCFVDFGWW